METPFTTDSLPRQTWRILGLAAVLLLTITVTAIGFISAGFFDPQPVGQLTADLPLQNLSVPAQTQRFQWLDYDLTAGAFSLQLTAAYQSGDLDSGYGLALGNHESALVIALSPAGYTAITGYKSLPPQSISSEAAFDNLDGMIANSPPLNAIEQPQTPILEWQTWPHVNTGQETNEIWLDKRGETITVRINREILWTGSIQTAGTQIGLWAATFNQEAVINFESLRIFY